MGRTSLPLTKKRALDLDELDNKYHDRFMITCKDLSAHSLDKKVILVAGILVRS